MKVTLDHDERTQLLYALAYKSPPTQGSAVIRCMAALAKGESDLDVLTDLVERTNCVSFMRRFMAMVPQADKERISGMIAVVETMTS